jgi:hypothetical protein
MPAAVDFAPDWCCSIGVQLARKVGSIGAQSQNNQEASEGRDQNAHAGND